MLWELHPGSKWHKRDLSYRISVRSSKLNAQGVELVIADVFRIWSSYSVLTFQNTDNKSVDIEIQFVKGYHGDNDSFDGSGELLAHSFYPGDGLGGDVHFDDTQNWSLEIPRLQPSRAIILNVVAIHEIGHALGLPHSSVKSAIMFSNYGGPRLPLTLNLDDIQRIQRLYGAKYGFFNGLCNMNMTDYTMFTDYDRKTYMLWGQYYWEVTENGVYDLRPKLIRDKWKGLNGAVDAAFVYRGVTYFFQGPYCWAFYYGTPQSGYPTTIHRAWYGAIPDYVDAVLPVNGYLWIFKAHLVWGYPPPWYSPYPKPFAIEWGSDVPRFMDAAITYSNGRIYFFKGNEYWRYSGRYHRIDNDTIPFPRKITEWWLVCENNRRRPNGRL